MDFAAMLRVLLQRWYVVVIVLIVTAVAAVFVITTATPEYQAKTVILLKGPGQGAQDLSSVVNPAAIAEVVQGGDVREAIDADVPYFVEVVGDGQILRVTASSDSSDGVVSTVSAVLEAIRAQTNARQEAAGIPEGQRVATQVLATPAEARSQTVVDNVTGTEVVTYTASGSVLFSIAASDSISPFPPTAYTLRVLQETIQSPETSQALLDQGATATVLPTFEPRDPAPIMYIDITGPDPDTVMSTVDNVLRLIDNQLEQRQTNVSVPPSAQTTAERLSVPESAEISSSNLLRPLVTVVGLGIVAALAIAMITEGVSQAINRRRYGAYSSAEPNSPAGLDVPDDDESHIPSVNGAPTSGRARHRNGRLARPTPDDRRGADEQIRDHQDEQPVSVSSIPDATETVEFRLPRTSDSQNAPNPEEHAQWRQGGSWNRPGR